MLFCPAGLYLQLLVTAGHGGHNFGRERDDFCLQTEGDKYIYNAVEGHRPERYRNSKERGTISDWEIPFLIWDLERL